MIKRFAYRFRSKDSGFTLLEIIVAMSVAAFILAIGVTYFSLGTDIFSRGEAKTNEQQIVRFVTNFINQELRYANSFFLLDLKEDIEDDSFIYFFVEDGDFKYRESADKITVRFTDMDDRVELEDLSFTFTIDNNVLEVEVKAKDIDKEDPYSLTTGIRLLNPHNLGSNQEGKVIAYKKGSQDPQEPCIPIKTADDLAKIGSGPDTEFSDGNLYNATMGACYILEASISLADYVNWDPIGIVTEDETINNPFKGTFNGNGFTISNLKIERLSASSSHNNQGLFGVTDGANLIGVHLHNVEVAGFKQVGGLAGMIKNSTIDGCFITGSNVVEGPHIDSQNIGGLIGHSHGSHISESYYHGDVISEGSMVGGLVGNSTNSSSVYRSYASNGTVEGRSQTGGLVGQVGVDGDNNGHSVIEECYSSMTVEGQDLNVGGLIGLLQNYSEVINCYSTSNVVGRDRVGGLIGNNLSNSNTTIRNSYSIGAVSGDTINVGGLIGEGSGNVVRYSYWDIYSSTQSISADGEGRPTAEMLRKNTYDDWDFAQPMGVWKINELPPTPFENGSGTINNPFEIKTPAQLDMVRYYPGSSFKLIADIDLQDYSNWLPIGELGEDPSVLASYPCFSWQDGGCPRPEISFSGNFDGNGYSISNLTIDRPTEDYVGLFGRSEGGTFKNITIDKVNIIGNERTGSLVGHLMDGSIEDVTINNVEVLGHHYTGGLVGEASESTIKKAHVDGSHVKGRESNPGSIGGLIGRSNRTTIEESSSRIDSIEGNQYIGGLIGYSLQSNIEKSFSTSDIVANRYSGGLIGELTGFRGSVKESFATGSVTANPGPSNGDIGGLIGVIAGSGEKEISNCYAIGDVSSVNGSNTFHMGGLIGSIRDTAHETEIKYCYSVGNVHGENIAGGLIGENFGTVLNSYYDQVTSGQGDDVGKGSPRSTTDMVRETTFIDWDFANKWSITEGVTYPCLEWQNGIVDCIEAQISSGFGDLDLNDPESYVLYSGAPGTTFSLPSGGNIDGSVYGDTVETGSNNTITNNIIALNYAEVKSGNTVGGSICVLYGDVDIKSANSTIGGSIKAGGNITIGQGAVISGDIYAEGKVTLQSSNVTVEGEIHAGGDVILGTGATVSGNIFANGNVEISGGSSISGDVHAGGNVILAGNATVSGNIFANGNVEISGSTSISGDVHSGGTVTLASQTNFLGNIYASGNVILQNSHVNIGNDVHAGGQINLGNHANVSGNVLAGQNIIKSPNANVGGEEFEYQDVPPRINPTTPLLPLLPPIFCIDGPVPVPPTQTFTAGSNNITVSDNITINPGEYKTLTISGGKTATLIGGEYIFELIDGSAWGQTPKIRLDLSSGQRITVFVTGNMTSNGPVEVSMDGTNYVRISELYATDPNKANELARLVYWEVHGHFTIGTSAASSNREWFGTVLCRRTITLPSGVYAIGAFVVTDTGRLDVRSANPVVSFVIADYARENW